MAHVSCSANQREASQRAARTSCALGPRAAQRARSCRRRAGTAGLLHLDPHCRPRLPHHAHSYRAPASWRRLWRHSFGGQPWLGAERHVSHASHLCATPLRPTSPPSPGPCACQALPPYPSVPPPPPTHAHTQPWLCPRPSRHPQVPSGAEVATAAGPGRAAALGGGVRGAPRGRQRPRDERAVLCRGQAPRRRGTNTLTAPAPPLAGPCSAGESGVGLLRPPALFCAPPWPTSCCLLHAMV